MTWRDWYDALDKPAWTPEPSTIGLIWQILYPIILVTFGYVFYRVARKQIPWPVAIPFAINLIANIAFTPIQFGLRNLPARRDRHRHRLDHDPLGHESHLAAPPLDRLAQIPYLIWVTIASVLQFSITWNNCSGTVVTTVHDFGRSAKLRWRHSLPDIYPSIVNDSISESSLQVFVR